MQAVAMGREGQGVGRSSSQPGSEPAPNGRRQQAAGGMRLRRWRWSPLLLAIGTTIILGGGGGGGVLAPMPAWCVAGQALRVAQQANVPSHSPVIINVGLPRSGTTTIHMVFLMMNVSSQHIVPAMSKQSVEEFRHSFSGTMKAAFTNPNIDAFGDRPCYGLIPQFRQYFPSTRLVASVRPKLHWLHSMFLNPSTGRDFLREWAFPADTVMAEALAAHFNDTRWLAPNASVKYTPSPELQAFIEANCSAWRGGRTYSRDCADELGKLERVYLTHRYLLAKHNVPILWTESDDHEQNCGVLTTAFPRGASPGMDELAACCATMREWPVANAVHDTMWAAKNKRNWLQAHHEWLDQQCAGASSAVRRALAALAGGGLGGGDAVAAAGGGSVDDGGGGGNAKAPTRETAAAQRPTLAAAARHDQATAATAAAAAGGAGRGRGRGRSNSRLHRSSGM